MFKHKRSNRSNQVTEELKKIYRNAYDEGIWLWEGAFSPETNAYVAGAGSVKELEELEKKAGREIVVSKLELGDIVDISLPGSGSSREEACLDAIRAYKEYYKKS